MSATYIATLKNTRMDAVTTAIGASGFLVIGTSALATPATGVLAKIPLSATSFGASAAGVITANGLPLSVVATGTGTANKAEIWKSDNSVVVSALTVGTSGSDVNLGTLTINAGNTVQITTCTITHG
jgi:hypothetical protein